MNSSMVSISRGVVTSAGINIEEDRQPLAEKLGDMKRFADTVIARG